MIVIPENLPPKLAKLTWLLGSWRGWGTSGEGAGDPVLIRFDAQILGEQVRTNTQLIAVEQVGELSAETNAVDGAAALKPVKLLWEESAYWSVVDPDKGVLQISSTRSDGLCALWAGKVDGPRMRLLVDTLVRASGAPEIKQGERLYGLVESDVFFTETLKGAEQMVTSGRVTRVEDPKPGGENGLAPSEGTSDASEGTSDE
ncbi:heme-binding beta-barrel domain-containing protein [Gleimia hominis]|uniref:Heme-binding beta-barrel domain-containing protein n=1 Tax=Gleimia hominis TaxID=595468 RepID=A0ABU3IAU1_9ACTO|nr:heme-binding beta-barrel domain-containing protein [Gleimia hominis]MDT3767031.1 heme-binding beta-barrel domain-containing protein [Gleimia hominis]